MSIFLQPARRPDTPSFAGGEASLAEIALAARDQLRYAASVSAAGAALERAIDDRRRAVHAATGTMLPDPVAEALRQWQDEAERHPGTGPFRGEPRPTLAQTVERSLARFEGDIFALGERFPEAREAIGAGRSIEEDARRIAADSEQRLSRMMASRDGAGKWAAALAGGLWGSAQDPVTLMSMLAGSGPGIGRTVAARLLSVAGREAAISAGIEAALQPQIQSWRAEAGLPAGLGEAAGDVLFAGLFGSIFGAAAGGAGEAAARLARRAVAPEADAAAAAAARAGLAPELRAAIDRAEDRIATLRQAPPEIAPARHLDAVDEAARILAAAERPAGAAAIAPATPDLPAVAPEPARIERVVEAIAGPPPPPTRAPREQTLVDFLIGAGGIREFRGELKAIGADRVAKPFMGRLAREDGLALDHAREIAAEAGYLDHRYGDAATAMQRSTVADLLDAIAEDLSGRPVLPHGAGAGMPAPSADEAYRASLASLVDEIARIAGPGVPDGVLERAARLALDERLPADDALERVYISADEPAAPSPARSGQPLPGWSDQELLRASDARGSEPVPDGIDDPGRIEAPSELAVQRAIQSTGWVPDRQWELKHVSGGRSFIGLPGGDIEYEFRSIPGTDLQLAITRGNPGVGPKAYLVKPEKEFGGDLMVWGVAKTNLKRFDLPLGQKPQPNDWYVETIVISEPYRGKGLSTVLLDAMQEAGVDMSHGGQFISDAGAAAFAAQQRRRAMRAATPVPSRPEHPKVEPDPFAELPDDFMIPGEDGPVSVARLRDEMERRETLSRLVEACRA